MGPCDIYYSGHIKERKFGIGFVVGERLRRRVLAFTPVDERLATIRIKARFFNISLICAHAPTEEKDDVTKDAFYERLEHTYAFGVKSNQKPFKNCPCIPKNALFGVVCTLVESLDRIFSKMLLDATIR